jgi:hypothetical protein
MLKLLTECLNDKGAKKSSRAVCHHSVRLAGGRPGCKAAVGNTLDDGVSRCMRTAGITHSMTL